jgi:hypothetical protein
MADPYVPAKPNDIITSDKWNQIQILGREELHKHNHTGDANGPKITGAGIDPATSVAVAALKVGGKDFAAELARIDARIDAIGKTLTTGSLVVTGTLQIGGYPGANAAVNAYKMEIGGPDPTLNNGQATLLLHHHNRIAHQLRYRDGTLSLEAAGNGYGTSNTPGMTIGGRLDAGGAFSGNNPRTLNAPNEHKSWGTGAGFRMEDRTGTTDTTREWVIYASDNLLRLWNNTDRVVIGRDGQLGLASAPDHFLTVVNNTALPTARFLKASAGPNHSHIQYGAKGDWYIRSSANDGTVYIQDQGGDWVCNGFHAGVLKVRGPDILLDHPDRRAGHAGGVRRALVHGPSDNLMLNYANDYTGGVDVQGTFRVNGASKLFRIDHPLDPDRSYLQHACIEGPEVAVYYRGEGRLRDGVATIELPHYFEALVNREGRTVQLTPLWEPGAACSQLAASEVKDGRFVVRGVDRQNADQRFYWEVKAVRADLPALEVEPRKPEPR